METSAVQHPVTDWFRADQFHPALPGYYEVRPAGFDGPSPMNRYWDGSVWRNSGGKNGGVSMVMAETGACWRGRRMWVLGLGSIMTDHSCLVAAGARSMTFGRAQKAMPFGTEAAAVDHARRYPDYAFTAILA